MLKARSEDVVNDDLVALSVAGDKQAEDKLISACLPRVWRTVYLACGASQDVEDLVQSALIHAMEKLSSYRGPDKFFAWLDRLTINLVRQHFRRRKLWLIVPSSNTIEETPSLDFGMLDRRVEMRQLLRRLARHMSKIRQKNRMALILLVIQGYTAEEMADVLGCSEEAAWKRGQRGYKELMERLKRDPDYGNSARELLQ